MGGGVDATGDQDAALVLSLSVETPDGLCADLAIADRGTHVVRLIATGPAGVTVELWADKPLCNVEPFYYEDILLDDSGNGVLDLQHGGSTVCSDALLGNWRTWLVVGAGESNRADVLFSNAGCLEAQTCAAAAAFCPTAPSAGPIIPADGLFVPSAAERVQFTPPPG